MLIKNSRLKIKKRRKKIKELISQSRKKKIKQHRKFKQNRL